MLTYAKKQSFLVLCTLRTVSKKIAILGIFRQAFDLTSIIIVLKFHLLTYKLIVYNILNNLFNICMIHIIE
jgi:hypothetical protein